MPQRYGAPPEAWDHFSDTLKLTEDLLPVVSNPNAEISPLSKMQSMGKTPSVYNRDRKVVGLPKWTDVNATEHNIQRWKSEPDYGICLQTRRVRAFDIDVEDEDKAEEISDAIVSAIGRVLPLRVRSNSGKRLLAFTYNRLLTKHVVPVDGGIIEVLADGQQFIAAGTHPSGTRYEWTGALPAAFPVLTGEEFERVWKMLILDFATGEARIAREKRSGSGDIITDDPVAKWLFENWETYDVGSDGQLFIDCPYQSDHTSDSGPSSTAYFPAGTGGYAQGHFVCLHAHCTGRTDQAFLDGTGFNLAQFADLTAAGGPAQSRILEVGGSVRGAEASGTGGSERADGMADRAYLPAVLPPHEANPVEHWPNMVRSKDGKIEPTAENIFNAVVQGGMIWRHVAYDRFTDNMCWAPIEQPKEQAAWKNFTDADMVAIRIELERRGFKPMGKDMLRECTHAAAQANAIDTASEWLSRQHWDGVQRIERFAVDYWGWADTPYSRAVGLYVWTAMAGRVLQPGVRADMAPILVGAQGIKKTSAIQAMAPTEDFYAEIKLDERDDDISRKLRGKLVGELEELRGLNSRAIEEIKAFVSRRRESWVPKFKEFENFFWRRCLLIGSTNDGQFLADPTGERRWLPGVCLTDLDVEGIKRDRDQLWAEGAKLFTLDGVAWEAAEKLAEQEHPRFKIGDTWENAISAWLATPQIGDVLPLDKGYVTAGEVLTSAVGVQLSQQNRGHELRAMKALRHLGLREVDIHEGQRSFKAFERAK